MVFYMNVATIKNLINKLQFNIDEARLDTILRSCLAGILFAIQVIEVERNLMKIHMTCKTLV